MREAIILWEIIKPKKPECNYLNDKPPWQTFVRQRDFNIP